MLLMSKCCNILLNIHVVTVILRFAYVSKAQNMSKAAVPLSWDQSWWSWVSSWTPAATGWSSPPWDTKHLHAAWQFISRYFQGQRSQTHVLALSALFSFLFLRLRWQLTIMMVITMTTTKAPATDTPMMMRRVSDGFLIACATSLASSKNKQNSYCVNL